MNKISVPLIIVLLALCGCAGAQENTDTRLMMDTFATITADCDDGVLAAAFEQCADYERLLGKNISGSDTERLNGSPEEIIRISDDTRRILEKSLYYGDISNGNFDITVCPAEELWDFENQIVPDRSEIAEALKNVDYHSIELTENGACLNGKKIDLGGIAKGYIADRTADFLLASGVKSAVIDLGGDLRVFGNERDIRLQKPFESGYAATLRISDRAVVTSGTYERSFRRDGVNYHHILDPATGFGAETDLASATVICENAADGDALATICILLGKQNAGRLIEQTADTEAVFIDNNGGLSYTSGIYKKKDKLYLN